MDLSTTKTSGIPRLSKLPIPRSTRSSSKTDASLGARLLKTAGSVNGAPAGPAETVSSKLVSRDQHKILKSEECTGLNQTASGLPPEAQDELLRELSRSNEESNGNTKMPAAQSLRKPRPSLSDRTVETLSQIPPSPSPRRRQSGFFPSDSPMRPPSRAASAMNNYSRPGSRADMSFTPIKPTSRAASPSKNSRVSNSTGQVVSTTPSRRTVSTYLPRNSINFSQSTQGGPINHTPSRPQHSAHSSVTTTLNGLSRKPLNNSKTMALRSPSKTAPLQTLFAEEEPESPKLRQTAPGVRQKGLQARGTINLQGQKNGVSKPHASITGPKSSNRIPPVSSGDREVDEGRMVSTSSQSLRQTIAQAKAARQKAKTESSSSSMKPRSAGDEDLVPCPREIDPFSFDSLDSSTSNILRQRINSARNDGKLNIAVLGLTQIPVEVMNMYDYDTNSAGNIAWYETVDLSRLNAADNEIVEIPDEAFPGVTHGSSNEYYEDPKGVIFGGLEYLDLHGNRLKAIPPRLGNLSLLTHLNLSRNQLPNEAVTTISGIGSLTELRLAENALLGLMPECICDLANLELLDVHENAISELPEGIGRLSKLRNLNVSGNKFASLPFKAMAALPLAEITASRNRLDGALLPSTIESLPKLRSLDVSYNALLSIMATSVELPLLQTVDISNNRIALLPASKVWPSLLSLTANQNQINTLPADFSHLKNLKSVDFCSNSLTGIDSEVGLMENLTLLRFDNNPLRERKLFKMTTEDLKRELQNRLSASKSPLISDYQQEVPESTKAASLWPVKAGVLDRSRSKLKQISHDDLFAVAENNTIKSLVLHHNQLQQISLAISVLADCLTSLDLSHNKLGQNTSYIEGELCLPNLQILNLTSNGLTSLHPLTVHLSAPKLTTLNVSFNRLTSFPLLCSAFPALSTLLASNNVVTDLDVEAVRGLQTLDVSSNELVQLPAKLAYLQGQLRTLMVTGNKFRVPGWGVLEKGTEEILKWCSMKLPAGEQYPGASSVDGVD